jgi:hypothetical protein
MHYAQRAQNWIIANRLNTPGILSIIDVDLLLLYFVNKSQHILTVFSLGMSSEQFVNIDGGYITSEWFHGLDPLQPRKAVSMY